MRQFHGRGFAALGDGLGQTLDIRLECPYRPGLDLDHVAHRLDFFELALETVAIGA
ncbi:hypothetical protein [Ensifer aridi]|uniref:hypothetical protein n=1 Tax=Ensifer aridi TaxID=1708715 RepID=UPI001FDA40D9|nr:hypothetical protein [Ensifer aridi]